jgi:general secretion pathway protein A
MYERFYGFSELPFELTANPKYLFLSSRQREALSTLQYGLFAAKSITLLIGEAGTGKTTLIRAALESERCRHVRCIYLNNPALRPEDFLRLLALKFNLGPAAAESKAVLLEQLEKTLRERRESEEITALVIDEAQSLSVELLEEIRLLANIETASTKLLPLVLAGQPELSDRLENHDLRQLRQRVTLRCQLEPFNMNETAAFIASRLSVVGGVPSQVFTKDAVMLIHEQSHGIPRTISVICDNALVSGMALDQKPVTRTIVAEVCRDFRLMTSAAHGPSAQLHPLVESPNMTPTYDDAGAENVVEAPEESRSRWGFFRRNRTRLNAVADSSETARVIT